MMERDAEIVLARSACSRVHLKRCRDHGPRAAWLRNRGQGQERFRVHGGAILDGRNRRSQLLESQAAGSDLLQPGGRAILPSTHDQENRSDIGYTIQSPDVCGYQSRFGQEGIAGAEPGAMCYMLSKQGYLSDSDGHWRPHLMFFTPLTDPAAWGAGLPGSPVIAFPGTEGMTIFLVPVGKWSDGSSYLGWH